MHNSHDIPSSYDWNSIELKKGHYNAISYSHQSFRLNQMSQNCDFYGPDNKYNSRSECINSCKIRRSISECGVIYHGIDVRSDETPVRFAKTSAEKSCVANQDFGSYCGYECPQVDCLKDDYKPDIKINNDNSWDYTYIRLIPPNEPQITYHQSPFIQNREIMYLWVTSIVIWLAAILATIHLWVNSDHDVCLVIKDKLTTINNKITAKTNCNQSKEALAESSQN